MEQATTETIKNYLKEYGWNYRETQTENGSQIIISNYKLENAQKGILISFHIEKEFLVVSTVNLLTEVPSSYALRLLVLNDRLKLVKLFSSIAGDDTMDCDLGFELWNESFNQTTFFAFMDMLCLGIEVTLKLMEKESIPHQTKFVSYN